MGKSTILARKRRAKARTWSRISTPPKEGGAKEKSNQEQPFWRRKRERVSGCKVFLGGHEKSYITLCLANPEIGKRIEDKQLAYKNKQSEMSQDDQ